MQTKLHSLVESVINIIIGCGVALGTQMIIFPWFDIHIPVNDHVWITVIFTGISLARSYILRRLFTYWTENN